MSCRWCPRQFVGSNTQCFERDAAAVSLPAPGLESRCWKRAPPAMVVSRGSHFLAPHALRTERGPTCTRTGRWSCRAVTSGQPATA